VSHFLKLRLAIIHPNVLQVTIDFLRNLPAARTVNVEPASADDWEVVVGIICVKLVKLVLTNASVFQESNADFLEQNLLSQVRAASPGQTVCVWVGKSKSLVKLRIGQLYMSSVLAKCSILTHDASCSERGASGRYCCPINYRHRGHRSA
jgi:hypothetical protein